MEDLRSIEIPIRVLKNERMTKTALIMYAEIKSYCTVIGFCELTNKQFQSKCGCTAGTASANIQIMIELKIIEVTMNMEAGNKRIINLLVR